jgi:catechol 2,3-dioxygenase
MSAYGIAPPGFRLPAGTHPGRVRLQVSDLERSVAYYEHVLGLRVLSPPAGGQAELGPVDGARVLVELHERRGARPLQRHRSIGLYHFALLVPDRPVLGRFVQHALARGAVSGMSDHLVSEAIYLWDPDGLGIEVYADRPRESWRIDAERQLAMSSDPLDVADLIDAGGGAPWDGMPAGAVMGHVHLHVGDLGVAEAFYHRALGFDKVVWTYPGALFLSAGGYHHHLGTNTWARGGAAADDQARLLSWDLEVPDATAAADAAASLDNAGYAVRQDGSAWIAADPWGTVMQIKSPREGVKK